MGRRGRKRQLAVEEEYWALVLSGTGTVAAWRQVGSPARRVIAGGRSGVVCAAAAGRDRTRISVPVDVGAAAIAMHRSSRGSRLSRPEQQRR